MTHSKKGQKGFQKIPIHLKKTERYNYKLTKAELNAINNYCNNKGITKADFFKLALNDYFDKVGITIKDQPYQNPNQLKID